MCWIIKQVSFFLLRTETQTEAHCAVSQYAAASEPGAVGCTLNRLLIGGVGEAGCGGGGGGSAAAGAGS